MAATYDLIDSIEICKNNLSSVMGTMQIVLQTLEREAKLCSEKTNDDFTTYIMPRYLDSLWFLYGQMEDARIDINMAVDRAQTKENKTK